MKTAYSTGICPPSGYYLIEEAASPSGYEKLDYDVVMHIRLSDNAVDQLYSVRYNSDTGVYEKIEDLPEDWIQTEDGRSVISIPNEKVSGSLVIKKTIDRTDPKKGWPAFMFRVTRTKDENGNNITNGEEYVRTVSFTSSDTELAKETVLTDLPIGTYRVEELSALHYTAAGLTVEGDNRAIISSNTTAVVKLSSADPVTVSYRNELKDIETLTYTAFADNKISYRDSSS